MGWKSWFSTAIPAARKAAANKDAAPVTELVMEPISALATGMIAASWECTQAVRPHLRPNHAMKKYPEAQSTYVHFEFLAFFMHLTRRQALKAGLSGEALQRLEEAVLQIIVPAQVEAFFGKPPDHAELERHLYSALNNSDGPFGNKLEDAGLKLMSDVLALAGYQFGNGRLDADCSALMQIIARQLDGVLSGSFTTDLIATLVRDASAGIEVLAARGLSVP